MRGDYKGAKWAPIKAGRCTVHGERVTPILRICFPCHREQLAAAGTSPPPDLELTIRPIELLERVRAERDRA
jgi:hypothetical protein